jgi:hypothetical protein
MLGIKNKIFENIAVDLKTLSQSPNPADRKVLNDKMAQFFDVVFKDIRSIGEVIM